MAGSLPGCVHQPGLDQTASTARNSIRSPTGSPSTWSVICCLQGMRAGSSIRNRVGGTRTRPSDMGIWNVLRWPSLLCLLGRSAFPLGLADFRGSISPVCSGGNDAAHFPRLALSDLLGGQICLMTSAARRSKARRWTSLPGVTMDEDS